MHQEIHRQHAEEQPQRPQQPQQPQRPFELDTGQFKRDTIGDKILDQNEIFSTQILVATEDNALNNPNSHGKFKSDFNFLIIDLSHSQKKFLKTA